MAIGLGRLATRWRSRTGTLRSMWGITPILTLPLLARCDVSLASRVRRWFLRPITCTANSTST
jgi:hypothetical protein